MDRTICQPGSQDPAPHRPLGLLSWAFVPHLSEVWLHAVILRGTLRTERESGSPSLRLLCLEHSALGVFVICLLGFKRSGIAPKFGLFWQVPRAYQPMGPNAEHGPSSGSETLDLRHMWGGLSLSWAHDHPQIANPHCCYIAPPNLPSHLPHLPVNEGKAISDLRSETKMVWNLPLPAREHPWLLLAVSSQSLS